MRTRWSAIPLAWMGPVGARDTFAAGSAPSSARTGSVVLSVVRRPSDVRVARQRVAEAFTAWGLAGRVADVEVVVSELATNALVHGRGPALVIARRVGFGPAPAARCVVVNRGGWRPEPPRDCADEGGRGLLIAGQLADALVVRANRARTLVIACFRSVGHA